MNYKVITRKDIRLHAPDGFLLYGMEWRARAAEQPCGVILLVHGMGEYIGLYDDMARYYASIGYAVIGFDIRGHGRSRRERTDAVTLEDGTDADTLLGDVHAGCQYARAYYPKVPFIMMGVSLGTLLIRAYRDRPNAIKADRVVLVSTMRFPAPLVRMYSILLALDGLGARRHKPTWFVNAVFYSLPRLWAGGAGRAAWIFRDEALEKAMEDDPNCMLSVTNGFGRVLIELMLRLRRKPSGGYPVLFAFGAEDVTTGKGLLSRPLVNTYRKAGCDVTLKEYEDRRHDLLRDIGAEQVRQDIAEWLSGGAEETEK